MKTNELIYLLIILYLLGIGTGYIFEKSRLKPFSQIIQYEKEIKRDTVVKLKPQKPLIIYKTKMKLVKTSDSLIKTYPFVAKLDTMLQQDTIRANYEFPQNLFTLEIKRKPDSIKIETIEKIKTIADKKQWWEAPAYVLSGVLLGYLIGKSK